MRGDKAEKEGNGPVMESFVPGEKTKGVIMRLGIFEPSVTNFQRN